MKTFAIGVLSFTTGALVGIAFVGACLSTGMAEGNIYIKGLNFHDKEEKAC